MTPHKPDEIISLPSLIDRDVVPSWPVTDSAQLRKRLREVLKTLKGAHDWHTVAEGQAKLKALIEELS